MSDAKHTPGPWSYHMSKCGAGNYGCIYFHGTGGPDKVIGSDSLRGYCGEANARLIAAAPCLLAACKAALAEKTGVKKPCEHDYDCICAGDLLVEAVAKAEGRA